MNLRLLILIGILVVLVGVVLVSSIQVALFYMRSNAEEIDDSSEGDDEFDSKEQIISELSSENERLKSELDNYKQNE